MRYLSSKLHKRIVASFECFVVLFSIFHEVLQDTVGYLVVMTVQSEGSKLSLTLKSTWTGVTS